MARIAGINIPQNKLVHIGLTYIYGIGDRFSKQICSSLEIPKEKRVNQWLALIQKNPRAQLYCARGGLRSEIAQSWLKEVGCDIKRVTGGFKTLRNTCLSILNDASNDDKKWIIIEKDQAPLE